MRRRKSSGRASPARLLVPRILTVAMVAFPGAVSAQTAGPDVPISGGRRVGAAVVSAYVGLGLGHNIVGFGRTARNFRLIQAAGIGAGATGLFIGIQGCNDKGPCFNSIMGRSLFYGGAAVYVTSRVWEFMDVIARPAAHNARIAEEKKKAEPAKDAQLNLVPLLDQERLGLALTIRF